MGIWLDSRAYVTMKGWARPESHCGCMSCYVTPLSHTGIYHCDATTGSTPKPKWCWCQTLELQVFEPSEQFSLWSCFILGIFIVKKKFTKDIHPTGRFLYHIVVLFVIFRKLMWDFFSIKSVTICIPAAICEAGHLWIFDWILGPSSQFVCFISFIVSCSQQFCLIL